MADVLSSLNLGAFKPNLALTGSILMYMMGGAVIILILYLKFRQVMYPIRIIMRKQTGGGEFQVMDDGKIVKQDGIQQLHVYGINKYFPRPKTEDLLPTTGMFKKYSYFCYLNDNNELVPLTFDKDYHKMATPVKQDLQAWAQMQRKRIEATYGEFWGKYGILVGEGIIALTMIIVSFIVAGKIEKGSQVLAAAIEHSATVMQVMRGG